MSWRYQPVYVDFPKTGRHFSLCEVYLAKDGTLESWTAEKAMTPVGIGNMDDLRGTLVRMLAESYRWVPVEFSTLAVGMKFKSVDDFHVIEGDDGE